MHPSRLLVPETPTPPLPPSRSPTICHIATRSVLTTAEAAAYCGYKDASAIRKAHRQGRLQPVGRRGGTGTWTWAREDLDRYLRGEPLGGTMAPDRLSAP